MARRTIATIVIVTVGRRTLALDEKPMAGGGPGAPMAAARENGDVAIET